jgi:NitT/TauT family transport system permease protein
MRVSTILGLATVAAAAVLLELLVASGVLPAYIFVRPSAMLFSIVGLFREEALLERLLVTLGATLLSAAMAVVSGVSLGWALYRCRFLDEIFGTWIAALAAAPLILLYPLFLVVFGRGEPTIIAMAYVASLVAMTLKTRDGLAGVRSVLRAVGESFRVTPVQLFWMIELPAAAPAIFTGIRLALIFALINVIGIEFMINDGGIGGLIADLADRYEVPSMYAAILFVVLASVAFFWATERAERWFNPA